MKTVCDADRFPGDHFGTGAEVSRAGPKCSVAEVSGNLNERCDRLKASVLLIGGQFEH